MTKPRPNQSGLAPRSLGSIKADGLMPSEEFRRRMGLGVKAWRSLLVRGLPNIRVGKQAFVDGGAALIFFRKLADAGGQP